MTQQLRGVSVYRVRNDRCESAAASKDAVRRLLRGAFDGETYAGIIPSSKYRLGLAVTTRRTRERDWLTVMRPAFAASLPRHATSTVSGVLLVRPPTAARPSFVLAFGARRYLLDPDAVDADFGLRVALNAISGANPRAAEWAPDRIRSVDAKRVGGNTFLTRRQSRRRVALEDFEIDLQRDLVRSVSGVPVDEDWGTRISGSDACRLTRAVSLDSLAQICEELEETYRSDAYRARFSWLDHVRHVTDEGTQERLDGAVVRALKMRRQPTASSANLEAAPPDLLDWDNIEAFALDARPEQTSGDLTLDWLTTALRDAGILSALSIDQLKKHTVAATLNDGEPQRWSVFRCLSGQIELDGETYLLDAGQYYRVDTSYLGELDAFVRSLARSSLSFPLWERNPTSASGRPEREDSYNVRAAQAIGCAIVLDRQLVSVASRTGPVEICDILTAAGDIAHVKKAAGSSVLSHLFPQGPVSADLLLNNTAFRDGAQARVAQAIRNHSRLPPADATALGGLFATHVNPSALRVVYVIGIDKAGRPLEAALPFFSKVNLRAHAERIRSMGFGVECAVVGRQSAKPVPRRRRAKGVP